MKISILTDYLFILTALFAHHELGRRVGVSHFITRCLTGASFSALIVATLANFAAGLIRPYLFAAVAVGGVLTARNLYREAGRISRAEWHRFGILYGALILTGMVFWVFNWPEAANLEQRPDGSTYLYFNRHLSYYANPAIEMLQADYLSRLRISNLWPVEWSRYHFFSPGTLAVAQALIPDLGLFSYFHSLYMLVFLILLSLGEQLIFRFKNGLFGLFPFSVLIFTAVTLFFPSVIWNAASTGTFSVFAMAHLVFAILGGNIRQAAVFSVILGVSVIRLYPLSVLSLGTLWALYSFGRIPKIGRPEKIGLGFFVAYFVVTLVCGKPVSFAAMSKDPIFDPTWFSFLSVYQLLGLYSEMFFEENHFFSFKAGYADRFRALTAGDLKLHFLYLQLPFLIYLLGTGIRGARKRLEGLPRRLVWVVGVSALLVPFLWASQVMHAFYSHSGRDSLSYRLLSIIPRAQTLNGYRLGAVALSAMFAVVVLMSAIWACSREKTEWRRPVLYFMALQLGAVGCQFFGNSFMKVPILMVALDLVIWALIAGWLAQLRKGVPMILGSAFWLVACLVIFEPRHRGTLKYLESDNNTYTLNIAPLLQPNSKRSDFVDSEGFLNIPLAEGPGVWDVYSVMLGARVRYVPRSKEWFLTERFIPAGYSGN